MKSRLYRRNVIEGEKNLADLTTDCVKNYRKHIAVFIGTIILACLLAVLLIWFLSRYMGFVLPSIIFVPVIVRFLLPQFYRLLQERKTIRLLKTDRNNYSEWMSFQEEKIADGDWKYACQVFRQYRNTFCEKHEELRTLLKEQLKRKPANQLIVCVFAGLIFLSDDSADYKLLFDAKYKHGAAGNMIPNIWIRILNPMKEDEHIKSHSECAGEFAAYWERKPYVNSPSFDYSP